MEGLDSVKNLKRFLLSCLLTMGVAACTNAATPIIGYVQISTGAKQVGGYNLGVSTATGTCYDDGSCQYTAANAATSSPGGSLNQFQYHGIAGVFSGSSDLVQTSSGVAISTFTASSGTVSTLNSTTANATTINNTFFNGQSATLSGAGSGDALSLSGDGRIGWTVTGGEFQMYGPASVTPYAIRWPEAQGASVTFLENDGSGNLSWATSSGGGGSSVYPATATAFFPFGVSASTLALSESVNNVAIPLSLDQQLFAGIYSVGESFGFGGTPTSYWLQSNANTLCSDLSTTCAKTPMTFGTSTTIGSDFFEVGTDGHMSVGAFAASPSTLTVAGNMLIGGQYGANTPISGPPNGLRTEGQIVDDSSMTVNGANGLLVKYHVSAGSITVGGNSGMVFSGNTLSLGDSSTFGQLGIGAAGFLYFTDFFGSTYGIQGPSSGVGYNVLWPNAQSVGVGNLQNDGSGNLSWTTVSGGSGTKPPVSFTFDGGGLVISSAVVSLQNFYEMPYAATVSSYTLSCDTATATINFSLGTETAANFAATVAPTSICASACPALSGTRRVGDGTLSGWTTALNSTDYLIADLTGAVPVNAKRCLLQVWLQ